MTVICESDARSPDKNNPLESPCPVCGNSILYRLGDLEAQLEEAERKCPVCKQSTTIKVPGKIRAMVEKRLMKKCPPEILEAATSWQKKKQAGTKYTREQRKKNPLYGQPREYVEKKKMTGG